MMKVLRIFYWLYNLYLYVYYLHISFKIRSDTTDGFKKNSDHESHDFYEDILMELFVKNDDYKAAFLLLNKQKNRNKI